MLKLGVPQHKPRKICIEEVLPCEKGWHPSGRRIYIDREAPLFCLKGWSGALMTGSLAVRNSLFCEINGIIEKAVRESDLEEESLATDCKTEQVPK